MSTAQETVDQLLSQHGAVLLRQRKHKVWQLPNGKKFTQPSTPSDRRATANSLADLKKLVSDIPVEPEAKRERQKLAPDPIQRKAPEIRTNVRNVTPELAAQWLETKNTHNRRLSESISEQYARDMKMGRWTLNGEPIIIANDGTLMDGQHRLRAVVISGVIVPMLVVEGIQREAFSTIDIGWKRQFAHVLSIEGHANTNVLASAVRWTMNIETGMVKHKAKYTEAEMRDAFVQYDGPLKNSVQYVLGAKQVQRLASPAICSALHYLFSKIDPVLADAFFDALGTGAALDPTDPVYVLRERLVSNRATVAKLPSDTVAAIIVKAWNATVSGKKIKTLKWSEAENFPVIEAPEKAKAAKP